MMPINDCNAMASQRLDAFLTDVAFRKILSKFLHFNWNNLDHWRWIIVYKIKERLLILMVYFIIWDTQNFVFYKQKSLVFYQRHKDHVKKPVSNKRVIQSNRQKLSLLLTFKYWMLSMSFTDEDHGDVNLRQYLRLKWGILTRTSKAKSNL